MVSADMNRSFVKTVAPWLLLAFTALTLLLHPPTTSDFETQWGFLVVVGVFTTFALYFGAQLSEGELSPAHGIGILAFLALPNLASTTMWFIALGGIIGGVMVALRAGLPRRHRRISILRTVSYFAARTTLSFFGAGQVYLALGGSSPFVGLTRNNFASQGVITAAYVLVYITLYFSIFLLEIYDDGKSPQEVIRENLTSIFTIMILPVPLAVLGAEIFNSQLSILAFVFLLLGMGLLIGGLARFGVAQYHLRRQVNELRSLSVVTQAMRTQLNLDTLLKTIYLQVAHLLNVNNFLVALYDRQEKYLEYPLSIREGVEEQKPLEERDAISNPLIAHVLNTRAPLLLSQDVTAEAERLIGQLSVMHATSWMGVPLLAGGRTIGIMAVYTTAHDPRLTSDHLRLLNIVAASASIAIENAQLYHQQTERVAQLANLNTIASLLSGTLATEEILDTVISSASAISQGHAVAIYLFWDDSGSTLALARSAGLSEAFLADPPEPLIMKQVNGQSLAIQPPVAISDVTKDKRAAHLVDVMLRERRPAWIELPLAVGEKALGVLMIYFDRPEQFNGENVELLRTFASQASQAINNSRTYSMTGEALDRRVEQLYALAALGRRLTATMTREAISDMVLSYAMEATRSDAGLVLLRDAEGLKLVAHRGYPPGAFDDGAVIHLGLTARAIHTEQPIRLDDVRLTPGYDEVATLEGALLSVPVIRGKTVIGAITVETELLAAYSGEDERFIEQIASQMSFALANMELFQAIAEGRDRLQVILSAMEDGLILLDAGGRIAIANPRVSLIGLRDVDLIGKSDDDLLAENDDIAKRMGFEDGMALRALVAELKMPGLWGTHETVSYEVQTDHTTLYIQRQIIPVRDQHDEIIGALLVFYNKTEEAELEQARQDLSSMIVHDLRSPLTAVTTSLKLLRDIAPKDSDFYPMVQVTTEASQRAIRKLLSRVDALLDISKMESGQLSLDTEPTELATLVDGVCVELSPLAHEMEIALVSEVPDQFPLLLIDADKVERLLLNLVDNALKYAPGETTITVKAHQPGTNGAPAGFVRIDVADQGPGIPAEYKQSLFDRFVQVQGRRGHRRGTGLGLTFCRLVTEAHGGRIWIDDNTPTGTIFAFTLPLLPAELLEARDTSTQPAAANPAEDSFATPSLSKQREARNGRTDATHDLPLLDTNDDDNQTTQPRTRRMKK